MKILFAATLAIGCGRIGYYPIPLATRGDFTAVPEDGGTQLERDAELPPITPEAGIKPESDAALPSDAGDNCFAPGPLVKDWSFSAGTDGWDFTHPGPRPTWNPIGALSLSGDGDAGIGEIHGWVFRHFDSAMDLTGTEITFRVSLEAGTKLAVQTYASSGVFASSEFETLESPGWVCMRMSFANPYGNGFDSTKVDTIGLGVNSTGPATFYIDDVQIRSK